MGGAQPSLEALLNSELHQSGHLDLLLLIIVSTVPGAVGTLQVALEQNETDHHSQRHVASKFLMRSHLTQSSCDNTS